MRFAKPDCRLTACAPRWFAYLTQNVPPQAAKRNMLTPRSRAAACQRVL
ncbi:hypothetical protein K788_0008553 (plasmid) [Paraburkholderia caribensis MBA4]|uniref:Uncharacterized protein n=1 Tax=Paraburkholderia caribensis MBA4 TaxID=1323664 RepID=A0A0P0RM28_9BURK|nr:hypothetical protein K788_0008553 [Paraburkholderia caribensis MBA4]